MKPNRYAESVVSYFCGHTGCKASLLITVTGDQTGGKQPDITTALQLAAGVLGWKARALFPEGTIQNCPVHAAAHAAPSSVAPSPTPEIKTEG